MLPLVRLLITGGSGYLGGELVRRAPAAGWDATGTRFASAGDSPVLDVRDTAAVDRLVGKIRPAAIVHTAYLQSGPDMADVNVAGSANVARAAAAAGARLVHLSTDFVFDGDKDGAYREDDEPAPVTSYGESKLAAERAVAAEHPAALLVRTSLLYAGPQPGPHERLVADAIAGTADVGFFTDELRCPIAVGDLAAALLELLGGDLRGPLHVAGSETVSRYRFAALVAERRRARPRPAAARSQRRPARDGGRATARSTARGRRPCWRPGCAARPRCSERPTGRSTLGANGDGRKLAGADPLGGGVRTRFPDRRTGHAGAALAGGDHRRPGAADRVRAGLPALADLRGEPAGAVRLVPRRRRVHEPRDLRGRDAGRGGHGDHGLPRARAEARRRASGWRWPPPAPSRRCRWARSPSPSTCTRCW